MRNEKSKQKNKFKFTTWLLAAAVFILMVFFITEFIDYTRGTGSGNHMDGTTADSIFSGDEPQITQFELVVPKLNISVPVIPNVDGANSDLYNAALKKGVSHYYGTALPGAGSNILIFGHSSAVKGSGPYSKIFTNLNDLSAGDPISLNFNNKKYIYIVTKKEILAATDISVTEPTKTEQLTLMTCWPLGTDQKRLVVYASPEKDNPTNTNWFGTSPK